MDECGEESEFEDLLDLSRSRILELVLEAKLRLGMGMDRDGGLEGQAWDGECGVGGGLDVGGVGGEIKGRGVG